MLPIDSLDVHDNSCITALIAPRQVAEEEPLFSGDLVLLSFSLTHQEDMVVSGLMLQLVTRLLQLIELMCLHDLFSKNRIIIVRCCVY
uniref:Uncharacterized protein n=1 Tax=Setaria viridis TaxID=4556 RepID=A0A4U6VRY1_SETVI|nr:hypothetical protein SEVIR_2G178650v2 [Setaria viridis]